MFKSKLHQFKSAGKLEVTGINRRNRTRGQDVRAPVCGGYRTGRSPATPKPLRTSRPLREGSSRYRPAPCQVMFRAESQSRAPHGVLPPALRPPLSEGDVLGWFHEMSAEADAPRARSCRMKEMRPECAKRPTHGAGHKADSTRPWRGAAVPRSPPRAHARGTTGTRGP